MDLLPSILLHFEELDDLQFQFSSIPDLDQDTFPEDTLLVIPSLQNSSDNLSNKRKQSSVTFEDIRVENPFDQNKKRKLLHRNVERKRRQDMTKLYESLLTNLPTQSLMGKRRSISDHMHEAMKYIQLMQKKIEELKKKRCKLNGISSHGSPNGYAYEPDHQCVAVKSCKEGKGMEVIVNSPMRGGLPLSRILNLLIEQGLTTNCCFSSKANDRLIHTIEAEVIDGRSIDPAELQQQLRYLVSLVFDHKRDTGIGKDFKTHTL